MSPLRSLLSFLSEFRRRRVFRAAAVYALVAWLVIQIAETVFPYLLLPPEAITLVIVLAVLGFPLVLVLEWTFVITTEGVVRERRGSGAWGGSESEPSERPHPTETATDVRVYLTRGDQTTALIPAAPGEDLHRTVDPAGVPSSNPSADLTSFVGREQELAEVRQLLATARLLTLTGVGGVGKTRLALKAAAMLQDDFRDGVWPVHLAPLENRQLVPHAVARTLGVHDSADRPLGEQIVVHLRSKQLLLVLDNCEHLVEACAELAEAILRSCPEVKILATSREVLRSVGEVTFRVPSLSFPSSSSTQPHERLTEYEAVRLLVDRARMLSRGFAVDEDNALVVVEICRRLDGIPLAIELAATRVSSLGIGTVARLLDDQFRLLTSGARTALPRHRTLLATVDWSFDLLASSERVLFRRLAVFSGGWNAEAAEAVCADDEGSPRSEEVLESSEVLDALSGLADKSLVVVEERSGQAFRYRLLEPIRQYARDKLDQASERERVRARHLHYFLQLAEQAAPQLRGNRQLDWFERLDQELNNFRSALDWTQQTGDVRASLRLCTALTWFWWVRGHLAEGDQWLTRALAAAEAQEEPTVDLALRAHALRGIGYLAWFLGDRDRTAQTIKEALRIAREVSDRGLIASCLNMMANMSRRSDDLAGAIRLYREALVVLGDGDAYRETAPTVLYNLAGVTASQGDPVTAINLYNQALTICEAAGDTTRVAWMYRGLGMIALDQQEHRRAAELFAESLKLLWDVKEKVGIAEAFELLGCVGADTALDNAERSRAVRLFAAAELLREQIRSPLAMEERDNRIARLRTVLTEDQLALAWAQGRTMPLEEAVEYALSLHPPRAEPGGEMLA